MVLCFRTLQLHELTRGYESVLHNRLIDCLQHLYDLRVVWSSETATNESVFRQHAALCHHTLFLAARASRILVPSASQQDWFRGQRRSILTDATKSNTRGYLAFCVYGVRNHFLQRRIPALESFCRFLLPNPRRIFRVHEITAA